MAKIFVSYAHVDKINLVEPLVIKVLRAGGHDIWYDWHLTVGQDWKKQLLQSIIDADTFVYALTPESVKSEYCIWEFEQAVLHEKQIIPVLLQKVDLPEPLKHLQYVDFTDGATAVNVARLMAGVQAIDVSSIEVEHEPPNQPPPQVTFEPDGNNITKNEQSKKQPLWAKYIREIIIGLFVTVVGGLILNMLIQPPDDNPLLTPVPQETIIPSETPEPVISIPQCTAEIVIEPDQENYVVGESIVLYGVGDCPVSIRASRFSINGEGFGEDAGLAEQFENWTVLEGETEICYQITNGEWETGAEDCLQVSGVEPIATPLPTVDPNNWQAIVQELRDTGVIGSQGQLIFEEDRAFVQGQGSLYQSLASDTSVQDIVLSAEIRLESNSSEIEFCALQIRVQENSVGIATTAVTVGLINDGRLFVDEFLDEAYISGKVEAVSVDIEDNNHLMLVAVDNILTVYLNGEPIIENMVIDEHEGTAGLSILGQSSSSRCEANNIWVYEIR